MSKRAEQKAIERYPITAENGERAFLARSYFVKGYEQAEKDFALSIEDLELLHTFLCAVKNNKQGCFTFTRLSDEQYYEVIRRFLEQRKK